MTDAMTATAEPPTAATHLVRHGVMRFIGEFAAPAGVTPVRRQQVIVKTDRGLFRYLSATLTPAGKRQSKAIVAGLRDAKAIRCEGHTDGKKSRANTQLGLARAKAVCGFLQQHGVKAKVSTTSYGAARPVRTTGTREQRAVNRRVVVRVLK